MGRSQRERHARIQGFQLGLDGLIALGLSTNRLAEHWIALYVDEIGRARRLVARQAFLARHLRVCATCNPNQSGCDHRGQQACLAQARDSFRLSAAANSAFGIKAGGLHGFGSPEAARAIAKRSGGPEGRTADSFGVGSNREG